MDSWGERFNVSLIPASGGEEESVVMEVSDMGVRLRQHDGKLVDSFPYSVITKWLPSSERTLNPGGSDCVDIQIQTTVGLRDLRIRLDRGADDVDAVLGTLQTTSDRIAESREGGSGQSLNLRPFAPATLSSLRSPTSASGLLSPGGTGRFGTSRSMRTSPLGPTRKSGLHGGDADIGTPPSRRRVDVGMLTPPRHRGTEGVDTGPEAKSNQQFLEDMVRRLSEELSSTQMADQPAHDARSVAGSTPPAFLEGVLDGAPLPLWLADSKYMNPLLVAYDKRLQDQEMTVRRAEEAMTALASSLDQITSENEKLMGEVAHQMELLSKHASADEGISEHASKDAVERLDLLSQENILLTQQQSELEGEIGRLTGRLEERTRDHVKLAQENSRMTAKLRAAQGRVAEAEAKSARYKTAAKSEQQRADLLDSDGAPKAHHTGVGERPTAHATAAEAQGSDQLLANASAEIASLKQQLMELLGSNNTLQARLASLQDEKATALASATAASMEADQLRGAVANLDQRLSEFSRKDVDVYTRIKQAMEEAEQAKLMRDAASAREAVLAKESAGLREKLSKLENQLQERHSSELLMRDSVSRSEIDSLRAELEDAKMTIAEQKASLSRAGRDLKSVVEEKQHCLRALENVPAGERSLGGGAATLASLEKLRALQEKLDVAEDAAEVARRALDSSKKSADLERQGLQAELVDFMRQLNETQTENSCLRGELAEARLSMEAAQRDEMDSRQMRVKVETELRGALDAVIRDKDTDLKQLTNRLEDARALLARSQEEHSLTLASCEAQAAKWREEAEHLKTKLDGIDDDHAEELDRLRRAQVRQLAQVEDEAKASSAAATAVEGVASQAESSQLAGQLAQLLVVEGELSAERTKLRSLLDRALLDKARAERGRESAIVKAFSLQKQLEALQDLALTNRQVFNKPPSSPTKKHGRSRYRR